jgi:hypothetical protein
LAVVAAAFRTSFEDIRVFAVGGGGGVGDGP